MPRKKVIDVNAEDLQVGDIMIEGKTLYEILAINFKETDSTEWKVVNVEMKNLETQQIHWYVFRFDDGFKIKNNR